MQLYKLHTFIYKEKPRNVFVTESSDDMIAGYEIPDDKYKDYLIEELTKTFALLQMNQKVAFTKMLESLKKNNLLTFKKYKRNEIKRTR
jgi:hypothetical protein